MLSRSLLAVRAYLSVNEVKSKTILLTYSSPLAKYTFLSIPSLNLGSSIDVVARQLSCPELNSFLQAAKERLHIIGKANKDSFGFIDLHKLQETEETPVSQILSSYSSEIRTAAALFGDLMDAIKLNINHSNFMVWMEVCLHLEIIQLSIWNRLLASCFQSFQTLSFGEQCTVAGLVCRYLNEKFMRFTFAPSRFVYRQNSLVDLGNIVELMLMFLDASVQRGDCQEGVAKMFGLSVDMTLKLSKAVVVNFNTCLKHYMQNEQKYLKMLQIGSFDIALSLLKFYSMVGLAERDRLVAVEQRIKSITSAGVGPFKLTVEQVGSILSSWSSLSYNNIVFYNSYLRPILTEQLSSQSGGWNKWTIMLYDMLASRIEDLQLFQRILARIQQQHPIDSKIMHIVSHYVNVQFGLKRLSSYPHCRQNSIGLQIVKRNQRVYSNCMDRCFQVKKYRPQDVTYEKELGVEHNPPQQFWLLVLKQVFQQLSSQFPHQQNGIYFNFKFCVFQLDALLAIGGQYIAFQLVGTHYLHKDSVLGQAEGWQGKKDIKSKIIKAYGLKACQINTSGLIERTIMSFQDKRNGAKYLRQKLLSVFRG